MAIIPTYFCDCCGHAFTHPQQIGIFNTLEVCPKCDNPDFELLNYNEKGLVVVNQPSNPAGV
jgi:Zn finger protein HypA/HybF involved in hydrogenase expression